MSVLSKLSKDDLQKRLPERIGRWTGRSSTKAAGSEVKRRAAHGWSTAKNTARSVTGKAERRWPKRAGIAAAAAGVVGGATAFLRDPERRRALIGKGPSPLSDSHTPGHETTAETPGQDVPTASNGRATAGVRS
jgi:hypothetical protein